MKKSLVIGMNKEKLNRIRKLETYSELLTWLNVYQPKVLLKWMEYLGHVEPYKGEEE